MDADIFVCPSCGSEDFAFWLDGEVPIVVRIRFSSLKGIYPEIISVEARVNEEKVLKKLESVPTLECLSCGRHVSNPFYAKNKAVLDLPQNVYILYAKPCTYCQKVTRTILKGNERILAVLGVGLVCEECVKRLGLNRKNTREK